MNKLTELRGRIAELGITQKDIAVRVVDWFEKHKPDDAVKLTTVEPKLSKFLGGAVEGTSFFTARRPALACAFELPADAIDAVFEGVYLLLDPRLDAALVDRLRAQAAEAGAPVEFVEAPPVNGDTAATRAALREASDAHEQAVVVLAAGDDIAWFEGRKRRTTFVRAVPRGYALDFAPDLVPVPPPKPAPTWAGDRPLASGVAVTAGARAEIAAWGLRPDNLPDPNRYYAGERRRSVTASEYPLSAHMALAIARALFDADVRGEDPAFALELALPWIQAAAGDERRVSFPQIVGDAHFFLKCLPIAPALGSLLDPESVTTTTVWCWSQRVYAIGPAAQAITERLRPHHDVVCNPRELDVWREALRKWNPFGVAFGELMESVKRDIGVDLSAAMNAWRLRVADADASDEALRHAQYTQKEVGAACELPAWDAEEDASARAVIDALGKRPMRIADEHKTLPLRLRAAASAELSRLPKTDLDTIHVLANIGAGHVLRIRVAQFEGDVSAPLSGQAFVLDRMRTARFLIELDGGATHAWVEHLVDAQLEGCALPGRARRRAEAERAARDDD